MPVQKGKGKGNVHQVVQRMHVKKGKGKGKGSVQQVVQRTPVNRTWGKGSIQHVVQRMPVNRGKGKAKGFAHKVLQRMPVKKLNGKAKGFAQKVAIKKGKGKVKVANKELDKLQPLDASVKVWVAGLDENVSWKKVAEHFKEIGKAKVALMKSGKACVAFATAGEADNAIASLNGSDMGGNTIEVDVWTQKEKKEGEPKEARQRDNNKTKL